MNVLSMINGHVHEAELTAYEEAASEWFRDHLDTSPETRGIQATAALALAVVPRSCLDPQFVTYLSDGTLAVLDGEVVPASEVCPVCGQADNCGDCNHQ